MVAAGVAWRKGVCLCVRGRAHRVTLGRGRTPSSQRPALRPLRGHNSGVVPILYTSDVWNDLECVCVYRRARRVLYPGWRNQVAPPPAFVWLAVLFLGRVVQCAPELLPFESDVFERVSDLLQKQVRVPRSAGGTA